MCTGREGGFMYKCELQRKVWAGPIHLRVNKCPFLKATVITQSQREGESSGRGEYREGGWKEQRTTRSGDRRVGKEASEPRANAAAGHRDRPRDDGSLGNTEAMGTPLGAASVQLWMGELSVHSEENGR